MVDVRRTDDLDTIKRLGIAAGLDDSERGREQILGMWGAYDGDLTVGGIVLEICDGRHLVNWMSVDERHRGSGIGQRLLTVLEEEARRRGIVELWATARTPDFYLEHGYEAVPAGADRQALLAGCPGCSQYEVDCHPAAVVKRLIGPAQL